MSVLTCSVFRTFKKAVSVTNKFWPLSKTVRLRFLTSNISLHTNLNPEKTQVTENSNIEQHIGKHTSYTYKTHTCGELRSLHDGENVVLCGWVQYVRLSKFLLLRDAHGITQCILVGGSIELSNIPLESVVQVHGIVQSRPKDMVNNDMSTGEIEVCIDNLVVLNKANKLPFNLRSYQKPKEQLRLQHRYIDLRFPEMQNILRTRSNLLHSMRRFLVEKNGFVEVETPTLFCRTPGGAREFVVPTHHSGLFYSLVQSPQQFKQMLMVGSIERYFQVARCYRDETTRPDRQPEFTQLDIELSFTTLDDIISLIEDLLFSTYVKQLPKPPFNRISYQDALQKYGTDKPNLSYDMQLKNISEHFTPNENFSAFCLPYTNKMGKLTAKTKEFIKGLTKKYKVKVILNENVESELGKDLRIRILSSVDMSNAVVVALGNSEDCCLCLGDLRQHLATLLQEKCMLNFNDKVEPFWIVDFPLFTKDDDGNLQPCHHPFTSPHPDDTHLLDSEPLKIRSLAYDLVMQGNEIGGGSVRIHNDNLQEKILKMLNIEPDTLAHFLDALRSGCPPHAGIALGIDRLIAVACKTDSIRDVIAFPKNHEGRDPLSGAPNYISDDDKKYYHINVVK